MADENNENLDSTNEEVPVDTDETTPEKTDSDEPQYTEREKKLFARAKKAETELKTIKSQNPPKPLPDKPKSVEDNDLAKDVTYLKVAEKKRQVGYRLALSPEETDKLFRFAGDSDPEEAFKDPFFKAGLTEFRREKRVAEATPSTSNRSRKVEGKTFAEMTSEERAKNWDKVVKQ